MLNEYNHTSTNIGFQVLKAILRQPMEELILIKNGMLAMYKYSKQIESEGGTEMDWGR